MGLGIFLCCVIMTHSLFTGSIVGMLNFLSGPFRNLQSHSPLPHPPSPTSPTLTHLSHLSHLYPPLPPLPTLPSVLAIPALLEIKFVAEQVAAIREFGRQLRQLAQEKLLSALRERNQAYVAASLQVGIGVGVWV